MYINGSTNRKKKRPCDDDLLAYEENLSQSQAYRLIHASLVPLSTNLDDATNAMWKTKRGAMEFTIKISHLDNLLELYMS